jgi:hypothetical protein
MTQDINQQSLTSEKGMLDLAPNDNLFNCRIDPASVATLTNLSGAAFKLLDVAGQTLVVDLVTAANDTKIFGFLPFEVKKNSYVAGDFIRLAATQCIMIMEASAAIARGASVEIVPTGIKVATLTTGTLVGVALDKAAANGDLIRVAIKVLV